MKFARKLIPTPPTPSITPNPPSPPDAGNMPAGKGGDSGTAGIPGGAGKMPSGVSGSMSAIGAKISQAGISEAQIREAMKSINIQDYIDENGAVRCPVPKADRERMMSELEKKTNNR